MASSIKQDQREVTEQIEKIIKSITFQDHIHRQVSEGVEGYLRVYLRNIIYQAYTRALKKDPSSTTLNSNDLLEVVKDNTKAMHRLGRSLIMLAIKDKNINSTKTNMGADGIDDYDERELEQEEKFINN